MHATLQAAATVEIYLSLVNEAIRQDSVCVNNNNNNNNNFFCFGA